MIHTVLLKVVRFCSRRELECIPSGLVSVACTDFLRGRGGKKGTLGCVLAPKRAIYHVLTSQGGSLVCFAFKRAVWHSFLAPKKSL